MSVLKQRNKQNALAFAGVLLLVTLALVMAWSQKLAGTKPFIMENPAMPLFATVLLGAGVAAFLAMMALRYYRQLTQENRRLLAAQQHQHALLAASPGAYLLLDGQGQVVGSQGLRPLLGIESLKTVQELAEMLHPAAQEKLQQHLKTLQSQGEGFAMHVQTKTHEAKTSEAKTSEAKTSEAKTSEKMLAVKGSKLATGGWVLWLGDVSALGETIRQQNATLRQLKADLQEREQVLNQLPMPLWLYTADTKITWCNQAYAKAVECDVAQVLAGQIELFPRSQNAKGLGKKPPLPANSSQGAEALYAVIGGQRRLLQVTKMPLGNAELQLGFARDITTEMDLEAELKRHIKAHGEVLEQLGAPIAIYGADTRIIFYNRAYLKLWGVDENFLKTQPLFGEILEDLRARRRAPEESDFQKYKKERMALFTSLIEPREDVMHLPDGITLRIMAVPHPFGGIMFLHEDVTDKLAMESSYNTLIAVQRETLDNMAEGIAVYGSDGKLKLYNPAFARLWQLPIAMLDQHPHVGDVLEHTKPLLQGYHDWQGFKRQNVAQTLDRVARNGRHERNDGVVVEYAHVPLPDGAVLISYVDISDSVRVEKALRETNEALAAADRLKSEFVANVSYQLRTPLNTIMGFAEILANQYFGTLNERQLEYAQTMIEASQKLLQLINDVLDLATLEAGRMALSRKPVAVKAVLAAVREMTTEWVKQQNLTLTVEAGEDMGLMEVDEQRIKQVLFNLVSNAIQYTAPGGTITITAQKQGDSIALMVADNGMGIPRADQERVFGKFERANAPARQNGAGLGLSLVKSFVELHGGRVEINSEPQQGTKVICRIPVKAPEATPKMGDYA